MKKVGNNGNQLAEVLHNEGSLKDGMTVEQVAEIATPLMLHPRHLDHDDFWEDFLYSADEMGYKLKV